MLFDDSAVVALQDVLAPFDPILRSASELGGSVAMVSLVVVTFWLCDRKTAIGIALVLLLSSLLNYGLKQVLAMPRPPEALHKVSESGYAMPSGHAQASGTFYTATSRQSGYKWAYLPAGAVVFLSDMRNEMPRVLEVKLNFWATDSITPALSVRVTSVVPVIAGLGTKARSSSSRAQR